MGWALSVPAIGVIQWGLCVLASKGRARRVKTFAHAVYVRGKQSGLTRHAEASVGPAISGLELVGYPSTTSAPFQPLGRYTAPSAGEDPRRVPTTAEAAAAAAGSGL